jgi:predicted alpha/beta-hydrolase family hydrolase
MGQSQVSAFNDDSRTPSVRGWLHVPEDPSGDGLVLTHGAGSNCESTLLVATAEAFIGSGLTVLRCDLAFRQARPHVPPARGSAERDQEGLRSAVEALRRKVAGRVFLGGHSYGGRQASMLAAAKPGIASGLLLLSYPLYPLKKPEQMRTAHFPTLATPVLFVQGTRDAMGTVAEMSEAIRSIPGRTELLTVEGAGHELITGRTVATVTADVVKLLFSISSRQICARRLRQCTVWPTLRTRTGCVKLSSDMMWVRSSTQPPTSMCR